MTVAEEKKALRAHYRAARGELDPALKREWDKQIVRHLRSLPQYRNADTLLPYVSMPIEVDTHGIIEAALAEGKTVAVPYCIPRTREMPFYRITSLSDLCEGTYGVLEPQPDPEKRLSDFTGALCLVPGLAFTPGGQRLGFGGGYYDRFLSGPFREGETLGLCYGRFLVDTLPCEEFDIPCSALLTEDGIVPLL